MGNRLFCAIGVCLLAGASLGCETSKSCTLIGCRDQFSASVTRADGSFPSGMHKVDVIADGVILSCTFTFPAASSGGSANGTCPSGLSVSVSQAEVCTTMTVGNSVTQTCNPTPGQYVETIQLAGAPAQVHASQYVDDVAILDVGAAPAYQDYFPNGPQCGSPCRQASASWTLN